MLDHDKALLTDTLSIFVFLVLLTAVATFFPRSRPVLTDRVRIIIPGTVDVDKPAGPLMDAWADRVALQFGRWFGGATIDPPGKGVWFDANGRPIWEPVTSVWAFTDADTLRKRRHDVELLALDMADDMGQAAVAIEYPDGLWIGGR